MNTASSESELELLNELWHTITASTTAKGSMPRTCHLLRILIDSIPDYIYIKDRASRFVLNNKAHLKLLGVQSQEEVIGRTHFDFYPPNLADQFFTDDQQVITTGQPIIQREELVIDLHGNQRWHLTTKVPLRDREGRIIGLLGVSRDITRHKQADELLRKAYDELEMRILARTQELARINESLQAEIAERAQIEAALRASEQRYKRLLNSVTDYIYTVYIEDGYVARTIHSPNCIAVTGYTPQEYEHNPGLWYQMIHPDDRYLVLQQLGKILSGQTVPPIEHRIIHKDGSVRWVRNTTVLRQDERGKIISYDGLISDITEQKQAEIALRKSESKYRQLMEHASDGIVILDLEGYILQINSKITELLGYGPEEILHLQWTDLIPDEERQSNPPAYAELVTGKTVLKERHLMTKQGALRPVEISARMIEPDRILAIVRDITELDSGRFRA